MPINFQNAIREEHMVHNDVLQHDFVDSFANLTLKTTFLLKWILNNNCSTTKFVFKVMNFTFISIATKSNAAFSSLIFPYIQRLMMILSLIQSGCGQRQIMPYFTQPLVNLSNHLYEERKVNLLFEMKELIIGCSLYKMNFQYGKIFFCG